MSEPKQSLAGLPSWRSHKVVKAARITSVTRPDGDNQPYTFHLEGGLTAHVDHGWACKHCVWNPTPAGLLLLKELPAAEGGYYVEYEDGYSSWSPAKAFENGYTRI